MNNKYIDSFVKKIILCSIEAHYCNATQKVNSNLNGASVHDKLDADICPVCQDVFFTATELMKHVFDEHYCWKKDGDDA